MSTQVQFRRGTTTQNNAFTGAQGELSVDTDLKTLRLHDGVTAGGGSTMLNNISAQTALNKTFSTGSVWQGNAVGLGYGGTGSALTAAAGAVAYSTASGLALSAAGTSGQILVSGGTGAPTWVAASSVAAGTATLATTATNIAGGSAGQLIIQADTGLSTFITAGAAGTFLKSAGAGYAPTWASGTITIGSTTTAFGGTSTSLAGMDVIAATGTSYWLLPVGTTLQRPGTPSVGMIRYNSDQSAFEGYASGAWSSLGGVKSVDAFTYIRAETTPTAGNGDLEFFAANAGKTAAVQVGKWNYANLIEYTGTLVGTQTTQNVFNATATTINAFGNATAIALGAGSGTLTVGNPTVVGTQLTVNLWNTTSTTVNAFGAATSITLGNATTSTLTLNPGTVVGANTTQNLYNTLATTLNIGGAATAINLGNATAATLTVRPGTVVGANTTQALFDTVATTLNIGGAATTVTLGNATAATLTVRPGTVVGSNTTQSLFNTVATTLNIGGAATAITLGASTGTLTIGNPVITGTNATTFNMNGASPSIVTTSTGTASVFNTNALTGSIFGAATTITLGANSGTLTIGNPTIVGTQTTQNLFNTVATTLNIGGAATTVSIGASTGTTVVNNNLTVTGNLTINGGTDYVQATNTVYTDNILELHAPTGGVGGTWSSSDGKDIGLRMHYYSGGDKNAALVLAQDTGYLEWYSNGTETAGVFSGTYGTIKLGGLVNIGNETISGTLGVTGATTLSSTLSVGSTSTFTGLITSSSGISGGPASHTTGTFSSTLAVTGATTLSSALTYGGVTLSNAVTGTGNMVLSASPTLTGTVNAAAITTSGNVVVGGSLTIQGGYSNVDSIAYDYNFTATTSSTTATSITSFPIATYRSGKLLMQVVNGTAYRILDLLLVHDGTNVTLSDNYGTGTEIQTGNTNTVFSASISAGTLTVYATASTGTAVVKGHATLFKV